MSSTSIKRRIVLMIENQGAKRAREGFDDVAHGAEHVEHATDKAGRSAGRAEVASAKLTGTLHRMGTAMKLGAVAAAGLAVVIGKESVDAVVELGEGTLKLQRVTGLDTRTSSEWVEMAKLRGIEANQLQGAFGRVAKQMLAAKNGNKSAIDTFHALGVSVKSIKSGNIDQFLATVADRMHALRNPTDRAALATNLFGRGMGLKLLPILSKGSAGIKDMQKQLRDAGATIGSTEEIEKRIQAERQWKISMEGLKIMVGTYLLPALTWLSVQSNKVVADIRRNWPQISAYFQPAVHAVQGMIKAFKNASPAVKEALFVIGAAIAIFVGGPITAIIAFAAVAPMIMKAWKPISAFFTNLWKSVTAAFASGVKWIKQQLGVSTADLSRFAQGVKNYLRAVATVVKIYLGAAAAYVSRIFRIMLPVARDALAGVVKTLRGAARIIGGVIKVIGGVLTGNWGKAWDGVKQIASGALSAVLGLLRTFTAPMRHAGAALGSAIGAGLSGAWGGIKSGFKAVVNFIIGAINSLLDAIRSLHIDIPSVKIPGLGKVGGGSISIPVPSDIPLMAKGGDITHGGAAIVGEDGPELRTFPAGARITPLVKGAAPGRLHPDDIAALADAVAQRPVYLDSLRVSRGLRSRQLLTDAASS